MSTTDTATFEFGSTQEGSTYQCSIDLKAFETCTSPHTYTAIPPGEHIFYVRATNAQGATDESPAFYEWTSEDVTPPSTDLLVTPTDPSGSANARFEFTGTDNALVVEGEVVPLTFECNLDSQGWDECFSPKIYTGLTPGFHTFQVRALDDAGNFDPTPAGYSWEILDGTPPETNIDDGPDTPTTETTATLEFSSPTAGATFECALDAGAFDTCESPLELIGLGVGDHVFRVRAKSPAGLVDDTPAVHTWSVEEPPDTTAPETLILEGPDNTTPFTTATFRFSTEPGATLECKLDAGPWSLCLTTAFFDNLQPGPHTLRVRAKDAAGNIDPTPATWSWTISEPPDTTITTIVPNMGVDAVTESTEVEISFTSDDPAATFRCSFDTGGDLWVACTSPFQQSGLTMGTHEFLVAAVGPGGNVDPTPAAYEWDIGDTTPPSVEITSGPAPASTDTTPTFEFVSDDPEAVFQCSLDGGLPVVCLSGKTYTPEQLAAVNGSVAGDHTFTVTALKQHLLVDPMVDEWLFAVEDHTAPETEFRTPPLARTSINLPAAFAFSSNEIDASIECSLDGAPFTDCADQPDLLAEISADLPGEHTLRARAIDPSGNFDATPLSHTWTVVGEPVVTISDGPGDASGAEIVAEIPDTGATFTFASDQPGVSTLYCSLDGAEPAPCTSPVTYTPAQLAGLEPTPEGSHEFTVYATNDEFVNPADPLTVDYLLEGAEVSYAWSIVLPPDTQGPTVTVQQGPANTVTSTTAVFLFSGTDNQTPALDLTFECSLDGAALRGLLVRHRRAVHPHRAHRHLAQARHPRDRRDRERRPVRRATRGRSSRHRRTRPRATASGSTSATWTSPSRRS